MSNLEKALKDPQVVETLEKYARIFAAVFEQVEKGMLDQEIINHWVTAPNFSIAKIELVISALGHIRGIANN